MKKKKFIDKVKSVLLVWGKGIVRGWINSELRPVLKKKINAGAVDKQVDKKIDKIIKRFIERYL